MTKDRAGLRVLQDDECFRLLEDHLPRIGRVAFREDSRLVVLPVNYRVDAGGIVYRTGTSSALGRVADRADGADVTFQADEVDPTWAEGWSVLVEGTAHTVTDPEELERLHRLPLHPWAPGEKARYVRIRPRAVTGRRIE